MKRTILFVFCLITPFFAQVKTSWGINAEMAQNPGTSYFNAEYPLYLGGNGSVNFDLSLNSQLFVEVGANFSGRRYQSEIFKIDLSQLSFGGSTGLKYRFNRSLYLAGMASVQNVLETKTLSYGVLNGTTIEEKQDKSLISFGPGVSLGYLLYFTNNIAVDISARYNFMFTPGGTSTGTMATNHFIGGRIGLYFR